jgi:hypothetical protein
MRIDHAARLAMGSRERWETGLRVVERTGDQLRVLRPFQRFGWRALVARYTSARLAMHRHLPRDKRVSRLHAL